MLQRNPYSNAHREYVEARVLSAQPLVIVEGLYQVAIESLDEAVVQLRKKDHFNRAASVSRAQEAVNELILSIDPAVKAPFTERLTGLYAFVQEQIIAGHAKQSEKSFQQAISVLKTLLEGWSGVLQKEKQKELAGVPSSGAAFEAERDIAAPLTSGFALAYQGAAYQGAGFSGPEYVSRDWSC